MKLKVNRYDVGLDRNGEVVYDLGTQTIAAKLQADFSFVFVGEDGKVKKSLPQKGVDPQKLKVAKEKFSELKKQVKKACRIWREELFECYLSGAELSAEEWKTVYLDNSLMRTIASNLVWQQEANTYVITEQGLLTYEDREYFLGDGPIILAHPMEMEHSVLSAWRKWLTAKQVAQTFEQIWEPVINPEDVVSERYKELQFSYFYIPELNVRGYSSEELDPYLCNIVDVCLGEDGIHFEILKRNGDGEFFIVNKISYAKWCRRVNNFIVCMDRMAVKELLNARDESLVDRLTYFELPHIDEFIETAREMLDRNMENLLLEYKKKRFPDVYNTRQIGIFTIENGVLIRCEKDVKGEIVVPDGVTTIGAGTFAYRPELTGVTFPVGIIKIGNGAFEVCINLKDVDIPDGLEEIEPYAFWKCRSLQKIIIPATVNKIGSMAFDGCNDITIHCAAGSYAEAFAKRKGLPYLPV